jgi:hypothetical protein
MNCGERFHVPKPGSEYLEMWQSDSAGKANAETTAPKPVKDEPAKKIRKGK